MFKPTELQQNMIDSVMAGEDVILNFTAGAGKTATALNIMAESVSQGKTVVGTGFTNVAVNQLKMPGVQALTTTSWGGGISSTWYWQQKKRYNKYWKDNPKFDKYTFILRNILKDEGYPKDEVNDVMQLGLRNMVDMARQYVASGKDEYRFVWEQTHVEDYPEEFTYLLDAILNAGFEKFVNNGTATNTDKLWLPNLIEDPQLEDFRVYTSRKDFYMFQAPDIIVMDEYQDACIAELMLINMYREAFDTQLVLIGDDKQAIYGWRGGASDALDYLDAMNIYESDETFRCCESHTEYIRERNITIPGEEPAPLHPTIKSYNVGDVGVCQEIETPREFLPYIIPGETLITARNVKGKKSKLIPTLNWLVENTSYSIQLVGFDAIKLTKRLLAKMEAKGYTFVQSGLALEEIMQDEEMKVLDDPNYFVSFKELRESLTFAVMLVNMCKDCNTVSDIREFFSTNFNNENADITVANTFQIKGQTYSTVVVLDSQPNFDKRNTDMLNSQEANIYFVGLTRSNQNLLIMRDN